MDLIPFNRPQELQVVLRTRQHAALYDPASQSLSLESRHPSSTPSGRQASLVRPVPIPVPVNPAAHQEEPFCPNCLRPFPWSSVLSQEDQDDSTTSTHPHYFRLLAEATSLPGSQTQTRNNSRSNTPIPGGSRRQTSQSESLADDIGVEGYYDRFFVEERKLGKGANGEVFLCQHTLNGNKLGRYAIKKIRVGKSQSNLVKSLKEVHLLESLHHPNIIHYQHVWLEHISFNGIGPKDPIPTLFVLMSYANGGSLADWISSRSGEKTNESPRSSGISTLKSQSQSEKLKAAFRKKKTERGTTQEKFGIGIHLLREEEISSLLQDMTSGLGFLHDRGVLHLDIKPANVLLQWDDDSMLPRALLSDFGSSTFQHENWNSRKRSGHTGTMEFMAPETFQPDMNGRLQELSSKADIWSLGMILHLLIFFRLPYRQVEDVDELRDEMLSYGGFFTSNDQDGTLPPGASTLLLKILSRTVSLSINKRPSCQEILIGIQTGVFNLSHHRERVNSEKRDRAFTSTANQSNQDHLSLFRRGSTHRTNDVFDGDERLGSENLDLNSEARIEQLETPRPSTPLERPFGFSSKRRISHQQRLSIAPRTSNTDRLIRYSRIGMAGMAILMGVNGGETGSYRKFVLVGMALAEYVSLDEICGSLGSPLPSLRYLILGVILSLLSIRFDCYFIFSTLKQAISHSWKKVDVSELVRRFDERNRL